jgi:hypothetical protein
MKKLNSLYYSIRWFIWDRQEAFVVNYILKLTAKHDAIYVHRYARPPEAVILPKVVYERMRGWEEPTNHTHIESAGP